MSTPDQNDTPLLQNLYDRVWLLAVVALLFWALTYLVWGLVDIFSVPAG